jgi:Leucine-rich repeat (LRR) protein
LRELYLAYNYISDEQLTCIEGLKELELLDISHNHIKEEAAISIAEKLPKLRIFINNMNEYTEIVFQQSSNMLEQLYLDENNLYTLEIHQPKRSLATLSIKGNNISEIMGVNNLPNLENLYCENNKLKNLDILRYMGGLKILSASSNGTISILVPPKNQAERIDLSCNELANMEFVKECLHLKYLNLSENKLDTFLSSSGLFSNLTYLDLS